MNNPNFSLEGKHFKDQRKINQHFVKSSNQSTNLNQVQYDKQNREPGRKERKSRLLVFNVDVDTQPVDDQFILGGLN